jgi:PAS domain S-box-containing protein
VQTRNGGIVWVGQSTRIIRGASGDVVEYRSVVRDITEQVQAERQSLLLARALQGTSEMITITDLSNRFIYANDSFLRAYGYTLEEILGRRPEILRPPRSASGAAEETFEQTLLHGWTGELINRRKDGSEFPIYLSTSKITDAGGVVYGLIGVARDISDVKSSEAVLLAAEQQLKNLFEHAPPTDQPGSAVARGPDLDAVSRRYSVANKINEFVKLMQSTMRHILSFTSLASHELRNPLAVLRSEMEGALRTDTSIEERRRVLVAAYDGILDMQNTVDKLLRLSQMQAGTFTLDKKLVRIDEVLSHFYDDAVLLTSDKQISVVLKKGPAISMMIDPVQMRQVLYNLLDNAIKHTPAHGRIRLSHVKENDSVVLHFSNSGSVIPPDMLPYIFDPFFRAGADRSGTEGVGLGLALIKMITEAHGGTVEVRSLPDEGTTFILRLPTNSES